MHKTMLTGVAAAATAALTLLAVAPASAETATETTVTTSSVPADTATAIPYDYDVWGDAGHLADPGAVEFPFDASKYDGNFIHSSFGMSAEAPEGCVRVVESFTFGYTLADYWDLGLNDAYLAGGVGTGEPLALATFDADGVSYTGDGVLEADIEHAWVDLLTPSAPEPQSGVMTLEFPEPVTPDNARGYIGFAVPDYADWIVDRAEFQVTDTCTSEVEIPVVVPPVVVPPVVEPPVVVPPVVVPPVVVPPVVPPVVVPPAVVPPVVPPVVVPPVAVKPAAVVAAQPLAETGVDAGLVGAAAALLLGAGAAGLLLARRRASN